MIRPIKRQIFPFYFLNHLLFRQRNIPIQSNLYIFSFNHQRLLLLLNRRENYHIINANVNRHTRLRVLTRRLHFLQLFFLLHNI